MAAITFNEKLKPTAPRKVTQQVIVAPPAKGALLVEAPQAASIREFLFEMKKDGHTFWIGAAVPDGTSDFSKVQVFFHPTVVQHDHKKVIVHAAEKDYEAFGGGWSGSLQRYVAMQGGQLGGLRKTTLIVPFMTMAAFRGSAHSYMFATSARDTLNAIMTAVRNAVVPGGGDPVHVARVGVSSFSSGIGAMRLFIAHFGAGLIAETVDFDSPQIIGEPKTITRAPGAPGRVYTQVAPPHPQAGWFYFPKESFINIRTHRDAGPHGQIGWMMFYIATILSVIA